MFIGQRKNYKNSKRVVKPRYKMMSKRRSIERFILNIGNRQNNDKVRRIVRVGAVFTICVKI